MAKHSAMFSLMLALWGLCLLYFNPRLFALFIGPEPFIAKFCVLLFIACLDLFWFYVFFHLLIIGFSYLGRRDNILPLFSNQLDNLPKIALLYATCNDFQEEALYSHLNQDYKNYHLFILDDSNKNSYRERIDGFIKRYSDKITIIRRGNRDGFKAGNLNYALKKISNDYEYFSISDADTILPPDYVSKLLPYVFNSRVAFAQANQISNSCQKTPFAQFMGINTDIHFRHYASTKNRFGFVMWYGHGALMRRDVWERVGGFPEIATEDLAYSMKVRQAGFEGVFVEAVACVEDYPATYKQYRRRNEKWIRGTAECLIKYYPSFIKAKHISWFEKVDVLVSGISLLLGLPFVFFLLLIGLALPFFFAQFQFQGPMFKMPVLFNKTPLAVLTQLKSNLFYSWDVFAIMLAAIFVPLIPAIIDYIRQPKRLLRYLSTYTFCFFSLQIVSSINLIAFFLTKKSVFPITADQGNTEYPGGKPCTLLEQFSQPHANQRWIFCFEVIGGIIFGVIGFITQNIWFLPISMALCASPCLLKWGLKPKIMRYIVFLSLVMTLGIIYFISKGLPNV